MANAPTPENVVIRSAADPTGNNQPAVEILIRREDDSLASSRLFLIEHGGQQIKAFRANGADADVFETDATTGQLNVQSA
jgi:hypothetical protein